MSKQKQPAPALEFKLVSEVLAWIEQHVKPYDVNSGDPLPRWTQGNLERAALWWWAHEEAQSGTYSELSTKDLARLLVAGIKPLTLVDIQDMLDELREIDGGTIKGAAEEIEANLRHHFLPKGTRRSS